MIEPRNFDIRKVDALIPAENNTGDTVMVRYNLLLRGQRAFHVSHCDYPVNWGEPDVSCVFKYGKQRWNGGCQTDIRQSDSLIVPGKPGNSGGGKGAT